MSHFKYCNAPVCLAKDVNTPETIWYTDEEICTGHSRDKTHRSIRNAQRGYQKRDKVKNISRPFTYGELKAKAEKRLAVAAKRPSRIGKFGIKSQFRPSSTKRNPK